MKREKAYAIIDAIKSLREILTDEVALNYVVLYPDWTVDKELNVGERIEYKDKAESNYLSYRQLIQLSHQAKDAANFRTQGLSYEKYLPYTSEKNIYTKEALTEKLDSLLNSVNETLFILKNLD